MTCSLGWLEPLLSRVASNPSTIACPMIDQINLSSMQYQPSQLLTGGFTWSLHFRWDKVNMADRQSDTQPVR